VRLRLAARVPFRLSPVAVVAVGFISTHCQVLTSNCKYKPRTTNSNSNSAGIKQSKAACWPTHQQTGQWRGAGAQPPYYRDHCGPYAMCQWFRWL
jgi:hypothetical protein